MADDYTNTTATTGRIVLGGSVSGTLEASGDADWFAVNVIKGFHYSFSVTAKPGTTNPSNLDLNFYSSNGVKFGAFGTNQVQDYTPTSNEVIYIETTSNSGSTIGGYVISASAPDDYASTTDTTGSLSPGQSVVANFEGAGDTDKFRVTLIAGLNYQFTAAASTNLTNPTTLDLNFKNVNDTQILSLFGTNNTFTYTPTSNETAYVDVGSHDGSSVGTYTITQSTLDDFTSTTATSGRLSTSGAAVGGRLEAQDDADWFAVSLTAGSTYQFNVTAAAGMTNPAQLDLTVYNGNAQVVGNVFGANNTLSFKPSTSGTYYLGVNSTQGVSVGSYSVNVASGSGLAGGATGGTSTSNSSSVPVFRFFDSNTGTQFLTSSTSERDTVLKTRPDLISEGVGLNAAASSDPNASAVYRFFDTHYGTHFFTSSSSERDTIQATRADLSYEGIGFYEDATPQANTSPVYRFFDSNRGTHFFTGNASERATILSTRADLVPEGVSFYAPNS